MTAATGPATAPAIQARLDEAVEEVISIRESRMAHSSHSPCFGVEGIVPVASAFRLSISASSVFICAVYVVGTAEVNHAGLEDSSRAE